MKLRILLYLILMNVLLWSCQKDYYLDELNAEKEKNEQLLSEIHTVRGRLASALESLSLHEPLHKNINGWYELKYLTVEDVVSDDYNLPEICDNENGVRRRFLENIFVQIENSVVVESYRPRTVDGVLYLEPWNNHFGVVKTWIENGVTYMRTLNQSNSDCGDSDSPYTHRVTHIRKIELQGYANDPGLPYTVDAIQDRFREMGLGFYSDEVYANIKGDDIYSYVDAFYKDAERNGIELSVPQDEVLVNMVTGVTYTAKANTVCDGTRVEIDINAGHFSPIFTTRNAFWIEVIYHELGHELFQYFHPYNYFANGNISNLLPREGYGLNFDIMGYGYGHIGEWTMGDVAAKNSWNKKVQRFFHDEGDGLPHDTFVDYGPANRNYCSHNKGGLEETWEIEEVKLEDLLQ